MMTGEHTVIRASNHHDTIVSFQTVDFIKEKAPDLIGHEAIDILEDKEAGACLSCFVKYRTDIVLIAGLAQRFDIKSWYGFRT